MSLGRIWSSLKTLHFSKPAGDRPLFRALRDRVCSGSSIETVLEVNVGNGDRSERLMRWIAEVQAGVQASQPANPLSRYAAIDAFEMGGEGHCSLKEFHSRVGKLGAKPFPVPNTGNLHAALTRVAHTIGAVDFVILDSVSSETIEQSNVQMILGRLSHEGTQFFWRANDQGAFATLEIQPTGERLRTAA